MESKKEEIDPDTGLLHISPLGMEHHTRRKKGKGRWYATILVRHFIIKMIQEAYPELGQQMKSNPHNATNILSTFLTMLPLQIKNKLPIEQKKKILRVYKLIK